MLIFGKQFWRRGRICLQRGLPVVSKGALQAAQNFDAIQVLNRRLGLWFRRIGPARLAGICLAGAFFLGIAVAWWQAACPASGKRYGPYAKIAVSRQTLDNTMLSLGERTLFPALLEQKTGLLQSAVFRKEALFDGTSEQSALVNAAPRTADSGPQTPFLCFSGERVSIKTAHGVIPLAGLRQMADRDGVASADFLPAEPRRILDAGGRKNPDFFSGAVMDDYGNSYYADTVADRAYSLKTCSLTPEPPSIDIRRLVRSLSLPSTGAAYTVQAGKYKNIVTAYAEKYGLATPLILAIMHTESNFNPFAVSAKQAVGLMQIVPETAGIEVYRYLMGTHGTPTLKTLFSPENNIKYGAAYLHLLARRYFVNVRHPSSRQMCMIAAYNGGPGAVLRMFDPNQEKAVAKINAMTPEQVYTALTTRMPSPETRKYVELVLGRMRHYSVQ